MTHQELRENLPDFVRGKCSAAEARQIEAALKSDADLKREAESLKEYFRRLENRPRPSAPRDFLASVKTKIAAKEKSAVKQRRLWFLMSGLGSAMALSIALVVFISGPLSQKRESFVLSEAAPPAQADKNVLAAAPKRAPSADLSSKLDASKDGELKQEAPAETVFFLAMNDTPNASQDRLRREQERRLQNEESELSSTSPSSGKQRASAGSRADMSRKKASSELSTADAKSKDAPAAATAPEGKTSESAWNEAELVKLVRENGGLILTNTDGASGKKWVVQISRARSDKLFKALEPHKNAVSEKGKTKKEEGDADEKAKSGAAVLELRFVFKD